MIELRDRLTDEVLETYETVELAGAAYGAFPCAIRRSAECKNLPRRDWRYWSDGRAKPANGRFTRCVLVSDGERIWAYLTLKEAAADLGMRYYETHLLAQDKAVRFMSGGKEYEARVVSKPLVNAGIVERVGGRTFQKKC